MIEKVTIINDNNRCTLQHNHDINNNYYYITTVRRKNAAVTKSVFRSVEYIILFAVLHLVGHTTTTSAAAAPTAAFVTTKSTRSSNTPAITQHNLRDHTSKIRTSFQTTSLSSRIYTLNSTISIPYFTGNEYTTTSTQQQPVPYQVSDLSKSSTKIRTTSRTQERKWQIYCDLDGVLVDFAYGVSKVFNTEIQLTSQNVDSIPRGLLWDKIKQSDAFFQNLPWCNGGKELWKHIAPLQPNILTGVPSYCDVAPRKEKFHWCMRELAKETSNQNIEFHHVDMAGKRRLHYPTNTESWWKRIVAQSNTKTNLRNNNDYDIDIDNNNAVSTTDTNTYRCNVITCWSERKHHESGPGIVLIDDRIDLKHTWEAKGGIFIHHITGNVDNTLQQLRKHGILPSPSTTSYDNNNNNIDSSSESIWNDNSLHP